MVDCFCQDAVNNLNYQVHALNYFGRKCLGTKRFLMNYAVKRYKHFCTAFAISFPRVCPESGRNPSSSSFGPWDDIYLTKRVTYAVSFMSQDSSITSDKVEAS
ncbi:hypothetical protein AVEN_135921-1 [Araneus ventricosus]|uniref:Uncharacterized protein n=1 Tax=Araneus ventricosus TaxID=182803 RepID=A0A4Y2NH10_ARAVE|nr:hypothetical protein AVEN_135921-1 [Araneus ventricosus]